MNGPHWTTVQMVIHSKKVKDFKAFLKSLNGEIIPEKTTRNGGFLLCRTRIPAENKEVLLDSQVRFL